MNPGIRDEVRKAAERGMLPWLKIGSPEGCLPGQLVCRAVNVTRTEVWRVKPNDGLIREAGQEAQQRPDPLERLVKGTLTKWPLPILRSRPLPVWAHSLDPDGLKKHGGEHEKFFLNRRQVSRTATLGLICTH